MKKKTKIIICVVLLVIGIFFYLGFCFAREKYHFLKEKINVIEEKIDSYLDDEYDYSWLDNNIIIAHAMGGTDQNKYSNSLEAFNQSYENGIRVFEVDLSITDDMVTVCTHDEGFWRESTGVDDETRFSYENFMTNNVYGKYTPLDYIGIINLLNEHEDVFFVIDGKYKDKEHVYLEYSQLVNYAKEVNETVLDRMILEVYDEEMINTVMTIYPFKSVIYSLYQKVWKKEEVVDVCKRYGIELIGMDVKEADYETVDYFKAFGLKIAVFTLNDLQDTKYCFERGISAVYSDSLKPSDFN